VNPVNLERRQWHLSILTISIIVILLSGMATLMFPAVFSNPVVLSVLTLRETFFGFCALGVLLVGYLADRQIVIGHLRKRIIAEERQINRIRQEASFDILDSLPGLEHFRDCLAMEFRRSFITGEPLSVLLMQLKPSRELAASSEVTTAYGDAVKAAARKLRAEDTLYHFAPGVYAIVLPGMNTLGALRTQERMADGMRDASGASERFTLNVKALNYPDHAATAKEMEQAAEVFLPRTEIGGTRTGRHMRLVQVA
jgi:GGDEF domain-containing protein